MIEKQLPYKYKVYEAIKEEILCGRYAPGDTLNERRLSEELGISRTPVREGLQMLAQDGWLQIETYKGAVVREFQPDYLNQVSRIRSVLEVCAIEDAVSRITDDDVTALEQIHEEQRAITRDYDVHRFILADRKFHSYIYELSGNKELVHLLQTYYDIYRYLGTQAVMNTMERVTTTLNEHQAVLEALTARDTEGAVAAMKTHMQNTVANMQRRVQSLALKA